ncbi:MAG: HAD-IC family P-type ATPase [bacterium]|nr:HAD-IC family P-type ATPase [bacterium]
MQDHRKIPIGLTIEEVQKRVEQGQTNKTTRSNLKSIQRIIFNNVFTFFNLILAMLAILLLSIGSFENTVFLPIAIANTLIGIIQELIARSKIKKLTLLSQPTAVVRRNNEEIEINIAEIVLQDIYVLTAGKQIVADSVIQEGELFVNEANLTGESDEVIKYVGDKILSGSYVVSGMAYAEVVAVGKDNYIEQLSAKVKTLSTTNSEILMSLRKLLKVIGFFIIPLGLLTYFTVFKESGYDYLLDFIENTERSHDALKRMAGAMIAMVPSGLFLLTTFTFANSVIKLAKHKTLVQQLYAIETLARVDVVCLDKTGTITDGTMKVDHFVYIDKQQESDFDPKSQDIKELISSVIHSLEDNNQTSVALKQYFKKKRRFKAKQILNFDSKNKYSAVTYELGTYAIGAPEMICKEAYKSIASQVEVYASQGKRVLLFASVEGIKGKAIFGFVHPIGLILINDTVRENAPATLQSFKDAGVQIKVISGDNALTVSDVARRAGVDNASKYLSLENISDDELRLVANDYTVFGRVNPNQKKVLIETFQANQHKVAMIGDGVNDILALKAADCSVALAGGSEAARNISHLVLLDNDFASLPKIVIQGRQIVNNMESASVLYLVKTMYTILLTVILLLTRNIYPFEPIQMFVIETFIIGFPTFLMAVIEPNDKRFKGNFLSNIFRMVIPGTILVIGNLLGVFAFARIWPEISLQEISTVGIVAATFAYLLILINVYAPLNKRRGIIITISSVLTVGSFLFFGTRFFKLSPLTLPSWLLLLLLIETTYIAASIYRKSLIKFWA